jgi:hypothetical protein
MAGWLGTLTNEQLAALFADKDLAEDWWESLSDDERIAFVAARPNGIAGSLGDVVDAWKDGLDADGLRALYTAVALAKRASTPPPGTRRTASPPTRPTCTRSTTTTRRSTSPTPRGSGGPAWRR